MDSDTARLTKRSDQPRHAAVVKHILFDADGVLQYATRHWQLGLQSVLSLEDEAQAKAVVEDIFRIEAEVLEADGGFAERLEGVLAKWDRSSFLSQTLDVIHAIEVYQDVMSTVQSLRRLGIRCHIASNQQTSRAQHMSEGLNYKALFDTEFYSCFVRAAKPKVSFFEKVVAKLGCDPSSVLFFDDRAENVEAARQAGIHATVFLGADGASALCRRLTEYGLYVDY